MTTPRLLLVEDDPSIQLALSDKLRFEGFEVVSETDGLAGWQRLEQEPFALILLDVMLPSLDGIEICRRMREHGITTPVLMLTARGMESDRVHGLEVGADDYVTKPFSARELVARIRAILRRQQIEREQHALPGQAGTGGTGQASFGPLAIDFDGFRVRLGETEHDLSPTERDVLALLVDCRGQVVTRSKLLDEVWGLDAFPTTRTIDFHVRQLRKKIEPDPRKPRYILTVHGVGYRFEGGP